MISLADLRARNVTPTWQEAVAVVQELIQAVAAAHGSLDRMPDLEHIALIPNGDVVALPGSPSPDHPVRHLGAMLGLLLEGSNAPAELTTFVERSTASQPQFDSAEEFSRALAFFERPGRRQDVERLVSRAMAAEAQTRADDELRRLKERTAEAAQRPPLEETMMLEGSRQQRSRVPIAIAAVVAIFGIAGAVWYRANTMRQEREGAKQAQAVEQPAAGAESTAAGQSQPATGSSAQGQTPAGGQTPAEGQTPAGGQPPAGQASADAQKPSESPSLIARAAGALKSAVNSVLGPPREEKPAPPAPEPPAEPAKPRARKPKAHKPAPAASAPAVAAAPATSESTPELKSVTMEPAEDAAPTSVAGVTASVPSVYTSADAMVVPPVMIRPVLPASPPPGIPPDQVGTLDLVIDETGRVAQVKLRSPMNRYQDRMLVAHAKSWIFKPALRDGQPVKYRTRVRVTI